MYNNHYMKRVSLACMLFTGILLLHSCEPAKKSGNTDYTYLEEISIQQLQDGYQDGTFTIEQVVTDYLKRIEDIDRSGPSLNSIIYVNPKAIEYRKQWIWRLAY